MFSAPRLLTLAVILWTAAIALATSGAQLPLLAQTSGQIAGESAAPSTLTFDPDYMGSRACAECHTTEYEQWQRSLHVRMTRPIAEANVVGNFADGTRFADHGRAYELGTKDGRPFVRVSVGDRPPETFTVDYTLGAKRYQGYLSTLDDGRIYVLPAFWHVESRRWIDWKEITPIPDGAHDLRQIWNANCFNCHATNLAQGFDVAAKAYKTTWTEMAIGCEACHGPGRSHVSMMDAWKRDPANKPPYDKQIFSPSKAPPRQVFDTCSYCHGNKNNYFVGFRAGDRYEDYALPFLISGAIPKDDLQGEFWPDGRPNRFNRPQALMQSGCFKAGAVACTNCHVSHGSEHPFSLKVDIQQGRTGDQLCTQCHRNTAGGAGIRQSLDGAVPRPSEVASRSADSPESGTPWSDAQIERHTFHQASSAGSRCISCHMSDVNWRLLVRRRDHTFQAPVPEITGAFGAPNSCTTCHDDRSPEWASRQMDAWWGDAARRKAALALADTMYLAGSGDPSVVPSLMKLSIDRTQSAIVRASAVEYIRKLVAGGGGRTAVQSQTSFGASDTNPRESGSAPTTVTPELINVIIGAAADPEPMVRAAAVQTLTIFGREERVVAATLARLVDSARVVRASAAESLLAMGIARLPGRAGDALDRAQDEHVLGLSMFPDAPSHHSDIASMQAERGRTKEAEAALDRAVALEPRLTRAWVLKGVLAAQAERFADAIELWKKAKAIEPGYPNLDRLIAEASARR
ncbi:MAG: HEAT repeat domain-containing protein [Acidobacteria bacterium]|nr:HEAT repeat domain-containing protein [Acidobacteriota bacterium]